ncbi:MULTISPECIES: tlde1 domain-containing protein [Burkholderia]|uniref:tlde1 domain-containing protein n=1 Tax=Burkholderia TaxID=32008 RepID=UPI0009E78212|nr:MULTISPECIES: tlde1 domain-containing protein [Burkholderia]
MGWFYDFAREYGYGTNRSQWFALYRDDGKVDDETIINAVRRSAFRLHPIGPHGRSDGSITLASIDRITMRLPSLECPFIQEGRNDRPESIQVALS